MLVSYIDILYSGVGTSAGSSPFLEQKNKEPTHLALRTIIFVNLIMRKNWLYGIHVNNAYITRIIVFLNLFDSERFRYICSCSLNAVSK
jgi:hypothetical protein